MARVFVTGDTHGDYKEVERKCRLLETTKEDVVIVLGDNGLNYYGDRRDQRLKAHLQSLPVTFVLIRGNHDRRPDKRTYQKVLVEREGIRGRFLVEDEYPDLLFCREFGFYTFADKRCFVIGGAYSVDKEFRLEQYDLGNKDYKWFYDEQLTPEERANATKELAKSVEEGNPPSIILSHTCPLKYKPFEKTALGGYSDAVDETMERWLDDVEELVPYENWYCGHWHIDRPIDRMHFLYTSFVWL